MRTYSSYVTDIPRFIQNSDSDNISWGMEVINDHLRYLTTRYFWNEESVSFATKANVQFYPLPAQLNKVVNCTVLIGNVLWQPRECSSRQLWDALNVIQFYQDYPYYYFIWDGQIGLWPTPTTSGDVVTINYKSRIVDLTMADVTDTNTGYTLSATNGSTTLIATGSGTTPFVNWMAQKVSRVVNLGTMTGFLTGGTTVTYSSAGDTQYNFETGTPLTFTDIASYSGITAGTTIYYAGNVTGTTFAIYTDVARSNIVTVSGSGNATFTTYASENSALAGSLTMLRIPFTSSNSTSGDNQWYPISSVSSGTTAFLTMPYQGQTVSGASFTIGQVPLLIEGYQDLPLYRMAYVYYTTRYPDPTKAQLYEKLYQEGFNKLDAEFSNKSTNVVLSNEDQPLVNPNLFVPKVSQN